MPETKFEPDAGEELNAQREKQGMPPLEAAKTRDRGIGPFGRLVLRGATVIDGTGAPPIGPIDIVVENGRIAELRKVGVRQGRRSKPNAVRPAAITRSTATANA